MSECKTSRWNNDTREFDPCTSECVEGTSHCEAHQVK